MSLLAVVACLNAVVSAGRGGEALASENDAARAWAAAACGEGQPRDGACPFSFVYGGRSSREILATWERQSSRALDASAARETIAWREPATGLELRCEIVAYQDFPVVEWTLYFKNGGSEKTPIVEDIRALDARFVRSEPGRFVLHHHKGSDCTQTDFMPYTTDLSEAKSLRFAPAAGRPCSGAFPFFNLEMPGTPITKTIRETAISKSVETVETPGKGVIVAVGWPGQWAAEFNVAPELEVRIRAGQELTHFALLPGEEVRSPLMVLQFWEGDRAHAQNVWRRWMFAHNLPRYGGQLPTPALTPCSSHQFAEMINANGENQKLFIDRYVEEGLGIDCWWMDAGWYVNNGGWPNTGTWEVDRKRFPNGLRAVSDHAHEKGIKTIVWFEPERVNEGSWLWNTHPEWLLEAPNGGGNKLLNLGDPAAREWLTNHIDKTLTEQGIDIYRQDYNIDPLEFWRHHDEPDRQGITEIRYVCGYLAYWDELRRRHPDMWIDSCASGGRRNDLETLRRAVPFLRSDYIFEEIGQQIHTLGINEWIPYHGTGTVAPEPYHFWSTAAPHLTPCWDMRDKALDCALLRKMVAQWRQVAEYYRGDYYPLTPCTPADDVWAAWQFNHPDNDAAIVQAFRRPKSFALTIELPLKGLDPGAAYTVSDLLDDNAAPFPEAIGGQTLMEEGLRISIEKRPGAAVLLIAKKAGTSSGE